MGEELAGEFQENSILAVNFIENILRNKNSEWCDDIRTAGVKEGFGDMVRKSFKESVAALQSELGNDADRWAWGKIHKLALEHPLGQVKILNTIFKLNPKPMAVGGSFHTVWPPSYVLGKGFKSQFGPSQRHIFSLANWDDSKTVIPTGESGIPASKFYCDQTKLYASGQYHSDYVSRDLIEKTAKFRMRISKK
jgi:penicillin amidase